MKPILYRAEETNFASHNGLGILSDVIDCTVIQTLNGQYELEMKYPMKGIHFLELKQRAIITAKPDPVTDPQPFRIYRITKPLKNIVTVYARHVAYDLMGVSVAPFSVSGVAEALAAIKSNAVGECPFSFWTNMTTSAGMTIKVPTAAWTLLGNTKGSLLDCYGGEYEFDCWSVKLWNKRGMDRGVSIRYGKNLTSLEQDENCANCYTSVYPYWANAKGEYVELPERIVQAPGNYGYTKTLPLNLSQEWQEMPTVDQLRERAAKYVEDNNIGAPAVSWKVEFVELEKTVEYKGTAILERVLIGDTVSVFFADMGISASARAVETRYKPVLERYENVSLGSVKADLASTIVSQQKENNAKPNETQMQMAIKALTAAILGASGGAVRLLDNNGDGMPDTLYIADDPDPSKAVKVWRFNYEGWGASKTGYNGPYIMGATLENGMLSEFFTVGSMDFGVINGDTIDVTKGKIAHFTVAGPYLYNGIDIGKENSCGIGAGGQFDGGNDDWIFWAGNGAFRVTLDGRLYTNKLIATGGEVGGWNITPTGMMFGNAGTEDGGVHFNGQYLTVAAPGDTWESVKWIDVFNLALDSIRIVSAVNAVGQGVPSAAFTVGEKTYFFTNGILTRVTE